MDWNEGYVTETTYTYGYYNDFNPVRIPLLFALAGVSAPQINTACELGYGQGVSLNIYAAAEPVDWSGTDFNPSQAEFASEMARASGASARCHADSFRDFCERDDLPQFDYIALHGIWSWISRENQEEIIHLVNKKLRVGGVLYISYNTFPGWANMLPARELMIAHADFQSGGIVERVDSALDFMERLFAVQPAFLKDAPNLPKRFENIKKQNHVYLAHEFFNSDWQPDTFAHMHKTLGRARMSYVCSAMATEALAGLGLSPEQSELMSSIKNPVLKEMTKDFIRNIQFRKDFWIKGPVSLGRRAKSEIIKNQIILLTNPDMKNEIKTSVGNVTIAPKVFDAIMPVLRDLRPHSLEELERLSKEPLSSMFSAICALLDSGALCLVQKKENISKCRASSDKLNLFLEKKSLESNLVNFLASPVSGGGVAVGRFDQIFLFGMRNGRKNANELARFCWQILTENGERMTKEGKVLETEEEGMPELLSRAEDFMAKRLPILRALQVA